MTKLQVRIFIPREHPRVPPLFLPSDLNESVKDPISRQRVCAVALMGYKYYVK